MILLQSHIPLTKSARSAGCTENSRDANKARAPPGFIYRTSIFRDAGRPIYCGGVSVSAVDGLIMHAWNRMTLISAPYCLVLLS